MVQVGDLERELVHRYPDDPSKSFYADPAEPDVRLEQASGWLDRALRLRTQAVVDTEPSGTPALILRIFGAGDAIAVAQVWRKDESGKAYARSSRFGRTLELSPSGVERLLDDAATVLEERGE